MKQQETKEIDSCNISDDDKSNVCNGEDGYKASVLAQIEVLHLYVIEQEVKRFEHGYMSDHSRKVEAAEIHCQGFLFTQRL